MSGGVDFRFTTGSPTEVVVVTKVGGRPLILAGTDGSPEAVEAATRVAVLMTGRLDRSVSVFIDVATATVREIRELRLDGF